MHPRMVATKHSKLPKIFKTQSPYINPVISPVKMLQLSTPSNSNLSALTLHMVMEEQQLHLSPEICFSHIISDLSNPPVSPVKMVAIICTTTHAAEKRVNMLIDITDEYFQAMIPTPPLQNTVKPAQYGQAFRILSEDVNTKAVNDSVVSERPRRI